MEYGWRTALTRWGDELWRVALVRAGDRAGAQQALVQAFERVYGAKTPPTDARTALLQALVPRRQRWVPRVARQRALPRALRRINPADRVLLALWLAHEHDGAQLAGVAQVSQGTLVPRLVAVLLPFLLRSDVARRTPAGRAAFTHWIEQQLGIRAAPLPDMPSDNTITAWQQAVGRVRDLMTTATHQQRLPASCRDQIETALTVQADETPAWQRRVGWFAVALLVLAIGWILRPTAGARSVATTAAVPQRADARTVVQNAIDGWTTMPISGTLHRRVWALDTRPGARNPALVTDVWLSSDGEQYRVETTHDGKLAEWHVVDSDGQLHTAAELVYNMCQWSYGPSVLAERRAHIFDMPSAQVRAVRDERLRSGTYGEGYRMLRRALHAPDLGSYGVRTDNDRVLITLGFRDQQTTPARTILLLIDARTNQLQTVRELAGDAAQTTARDIWRLETHETVATVPTALPRWDGKPQRSADVFDPACPELERSNVISVRRMAAITSPYSGPYGVTYVPTPLPSNVTRAAFVTFAPVDQNGFLSGSGAQLVLRSADGWLRIRNSENIQAPIGAADDVQHGTWTVRFEQADGANDALSATVWQQPDDASLNPNMGYGPVLTVDALGWTRDQLLETVERLQPINERMWPMLASQFLDPRPLTPDVEQVLLGAQQAINPPRSGTLHTVIETTAHQEQAAQPVRDDPYHIPQRSVSQERLRIAHWAVVSDTTLLRSKQLISAPDGTLFSAEVDSGSAFATYYAGEAITYRSAYEAGDESTFNPYMKDGLRLDLARSLFAVDAPITMTAHGESWRFEQVLPGNAQSGFGYGLDFSPLRDIPYTGGSWFDGPQNGTLVQRVWLDQQSNLGRRWELARRTEGGETIVSSLAVQAWGVLPSQPDDAFWALPPLPPETLLVEGDPQTGKITKIETTNGPLALSPPQRALVWQPDSGLNMTRDEPYSSTPRVATIGGYSNTDPLGALLNASINDLSNTGWVRFTAYMVPDTTLVVQVTQGPRALLRHVLRRSWYDQSLQGTTFPESQPIEVTIAGAQHQAWILRDSSGGSALVVELDDLLLHIKANDAYLTGVLLEQLPALQWEDVRLDPAPGANDVSLVPSGAATEVRP